MTEAQIEAKMVRMVRERGGLCYKFVSPNNPGVPDRIVITPDGAPLCRTENGDRQVDQDSGMADS